MHPHPNVVSILRASNAGRFDGYAQCLLIEFHSEPKKALSDSEASLSPGEFGEQAGVSLSSGARALAIAP